MMLLLLNFFFVSDGLTKSTRIQSASSFYANLIFLSKAGNLPEEQSVSIKLQYYFFPNAEQQLESNP
jgi:hypothetical protein